MKTKGLLLTFIICFCLGLGSSAQNMLERYQKAEQLLPKNISKLVRNMHIIPSWVKDSDDFWYKIETVSGYQYMYFNADRKTLAKAFDHRKMADAIEGLIGKKQNPDSLNLDNIKFGKGGNLTFKVDNKILKVNLAFYDISIIDKDEELLKNQSRSPDGKWIVSVKAYNLYLKDVDTGNEIALTTNGIEKYEYATPISWYKLKNESDGTDEYDPVISINWSPDSRKFVCFRLDRREVGNLYLYQSLPDSGMKAKIWSYERALPGENPIKKEFYIFDVISKENVKIDIPAFADFNSSIDPQWIGDKGRELYLARFERGYKKIDVFRIDARTGKAQTIFSDESLTMIEYQNISCKWLNDGSKFFWTSERDGWNHIYAIDGKTGAVIKQLTEGEFVVHSIEKVDEKNESIFFIVGGKEKRKDPYYRHLYSIDFNGNHFKTLTSENADHSISLSPLGNYFTDSYSTIETVPKHVLRSASNGRVISELAISDISKLMSAGYKMPQPFKVKARDGETDIYGAIFYPTHFDPDKKYPVIDATYSGPQAVRTPKSFERAYRSTDVSLAELGFIVVTIDGLGTAKRSKAFHDFSYENLGDIGAEDHISGMKQLSKDHPYMDLDRVGIYGHSAGGYDAAHALLTHPEFYSVAVSSAGNHDHGMAKAWWPEQYMGMPGKHYQEQSNLTLAKNLQGKLLLMHGDMDNNVNPASSQRFAAELIKANKDFELVLIPNKNHGMSDHPYFIRKRWDWFVTHLLGETPPKEFNISTYN